MDVSEVLADLIAEQEALDEIVSTLDDEQWELATASPRWRVKEQIAHLTYFDDTAAVAITDPDRFKALVSELWENAGGGDEALDAMTLGSLIALEPSDLLAAWRKNRAALAAASQGLANDTRVIWYGPSMGSKSFLTARLMEAWAHGQDIADAVGVVRQASDRIRHIAQLGYITRGWTYQNRQLDAPTVPVRVSIESPSGEVWSYGPEDAPELITGKAEDFCLVVTQRRNVADTGLIVDGTSAMEWMTMAQAFAGAPTDGPAPAQ